MAETQRTRVYRWTSAHVDRTRPAPTLDEARKLVQRACLDYDVAPPPVVRNRRRKDTAVWNRKTQRVEIGRNAFYAEHLLHEAAHVIQDKRELLDDPQTNWNGRIANADWHGPMFVRLYLELVRRYVGEERYVLAERLRRTARVKSSTFLVPPRESASFAAVEA